MIINTNISSVNTNRLLNINSENMSKDIERLSSGKRINSSADDAAGLAVAEKLRSQYEGLGQASRNASNGISFIQTADNALQETTNNLNRLRVLAVEAANGIYEASDRSNIQQEVNQRVSEVDRISKQVQFNRMNPLNGTFSKNPLVIHVGANADEAISTTIGDMGSKSLGINQVKLDNVSDANAAILTLSKAIDDVTTERARLGAFQNRLQSAIRTDDVGSQNMLASQSRITDADMAKQISNFTKDNILTQSSSAMLAQANAKNQIVLKLLS